MQGVKEFKMSVGRRAHEFRSGATGKAQITEVRKIERVEGSEYGNSAGNRRAQGG